VANNSIRSADKGGVTGDLRQLGSDGVNTERGQRSTVGATFAAATAFASTVESHGILTTDATCGVAADAGDDTARAATTRTGPHVTDSSF
jgi:hypothetical protein